VCPDPDPNISKHSSVEVIQGNATYGLLGEASAVLGNVLERVELSDKEPLEIGRHLCICMDGVD